MRLSVAMVVSLFGLNVWAAQDCPSFNFENLVCTIRNDHFEATFEVKARSLLEKSDGWRLSEIDDEGNLFEMPIPSVFDEEGVHTEYYCKDKQLIARDTAEDVVGDMRLTLNNRGYVWEGESLIWNTRCDENGCRTTIGKIETQTTCTLK